MVIVARGKAIDADFSALTGNFLALARKAGILAEETL
jgi:hypothetical protein